MKWVTRHFKFILFAEQTINSEQKKKMGVGAVFLVGSNSKGTQHTNTLKTYNSVLLNEKYMKRINGNVE